ncbi:MAG: BamA/TamA family outer membrane protein, partial [Candidatus Cloacimonetes bacterium]|nr:BamA/TamA family outer membrane protein [Candidatus Cloacimonadota bacterium]
KLYIMDEQKKKILNRYSFDDLDAIFEIDVSHDGKKIVFSAQQNMQSDLYIFELESETRQQITNDRYNDASPRWSCDDSRIAFTSERTIVEKVNSEQIFYQLRDNILIYHVTNEKFTQVTQDDFNNHSPQWAPADSLLLFISERKDVANYEAIRLETAERARITKTLCGVFPGDLISTGDILVYSCFFNMGWDIYLMNNPLENLEFEPYQKSIVLTPRNDFYQRFNIDRYQRYGKKRGKFKKVFPKTYKRNVTEINFGNAVQSDSLNRAYNRNLDTKPDSIFQIPRITPYRLKMSLDRFWGGMAYSTGVGAIGFVQFSMSDLFGDHGIAVQAGFGGSFDNSDFILNYIFRGSRLDYGLGFIFLTDDTYYNNGWLSSDGFLYDYKILRKRYGGYLLTSYPFNKYWRVDLENFVYQREDSDYIWDEQDEKWQAVNYIDQKALVYKPQLSLVHDNALYGPTGPISGWRASYMINKSFSREFDYLTQYLDFRYYQYLAKQFAIAMRGVGGISLGNDPQVFELWGYNGVRGFDDSDLEGDTKFVGSLELRYPFIEYLKFNFPLPLTISYLRGSLFADVGSVWFRDNGFVGTQNGRLNDLKFGFGFGPRLNVGYFVLKLDIAWNSDWIDTSKPRYYIWLMQDF